MTDASSLTLFNSLTRQLEPFQPVHEGEARVYSCGPTVYNYPHIGNMRAYVFADILGRTLSHKGYKLTHVINITDVGHLTDDADAGEDKMEKMAKAQSQSIWDIAAHYTQAYWADIKALNIRQPAKWSIATDYVPQMIEFAEKIAPNHCYELESGLYFDVSTVSDYGRLARAVTDEGEGRIEAVEGKRNAADFAIWRKTPAGEKRQMEWDSPWGRGAPGWHLECSVMSGDLLGFPFDIHTGGIDHREIHHPNEIAQNQAFCCAPEEACGLDVPANSGAKVWMHNNFLVERSGKMSKSSGEFLRLQLLIDKGYHPLGYRMMCLQAHYRSELEFSWEGLAAALVRLKRMIIVVERLGDVEAGDAGHPKLAPMLETFEKAIGDDLNTAVALTALEDVLAAKKVDASAKRAVVERMDAVLGLDLFGTRRADLRLRPKAAEITEAEIEDVLARRKAARAEKDFATSDALRDELAAKGVEAMDGDPLGWEWKLG
ncbi:MAG: cysteine--tRNA ligase [Novosphingobium pentaromativorans]|uniref:Cysteine--tRNA ligase n=1 Tax=Novosphingobium pentaromativorans TaxID=205844 RepID=A0A2W5QUC2_9SPHN|nr:cysteine--tRNA ligase [Novosphingobium panipatense]PZQ55060.1 MAG: cysteine--tRNA ligase [Novosphingobium pentaromativorans]